MAIPGFQDFMLPLLRYVDANGDVAKKEYDEALAQEFLLTEAEREEMIASGGDFVYTNRIGWAASYLVKAGLLERPKRATVRVTPVGKEALAESPRYINIRFLKKYSDLWDNHVAKPKPGNTPEDEDSTKSPEERLTEAFDDLQDALATDLLALVRAASPTFFERLVVRVLVSMGYGGSLEDAGKAIGKSGDGGIDGIIKEDRLGLDSIYIQAKRWENPVGRPEIQAFAGALMGMNANRGVFITSSDFTTGARDYVKKLQTKIVLINGQELADLMIEYGVGVIDEQTYRVKRVDPEYFGE